MHIITKSFQEKELDKRLSKFIYLYRLVNGNLYKILGTCRALLIKQQFMNNNMYLIFFLIKCILDI